MCIRDREVEGGKMLSPNRQLLSNREITSFLFSNPCSQRCHLCLGVEQLKYIFLKKSLQVFVNLQGLFCFYLFFELNLIIFVFSRSNYRSYHWQINPFFFRLTNTSNSKETTRCLSNMLCKTHHTLI